MKRRAKWLFSLAGMAVLGGYAFSQIPVPGAPAGVGLPGIAPGPAAPTPPKTLWGFLGLSKEQKEFCLRKLCQKPLGQLLNNGIAPISTLSGGLISPFCPVTPTIADLADQGAVGAAAKIKLDEAEAAKRRAAVRYLGTVDCHYWPEAEEALIGALRGDRNECVRYEAALALANGCCCTKKTMEALTIVVSCSNRDGAPKETSMRVHEAAQMALDHCLACYNPVTPTPPVVGPKPEVEVVPEKKPEVLPPPPPPVPPGAAQSSTPVELGENKPYSVDGQKPAVAAKPANARPVGFAYYAHIAHVPWEPLVAEARRVAAMPMRVRNTQDQSLVGMLVAATSEKPVASETKMESAPVAKTASVAPPMAMSASAAKPMSTMTAAVPAKTAARVSTTPTYTGWNDPPAKSVYHESASTMPQAPVISSPKMATKPVPTKPSAEELSTPPPTHVPSMDMQVQPPKSGVSAPVATSPATLSPSITPYAPIMTVPKTATEMPAPTGEGTTTIPQPVRMPSMETPIQPRKSVDTAPGSALSAAPTPVTPYAPITPSVVSRPASMPPAPAKTTITVHAEEPVAPIPAPRLIAPPAPTPAPAMMTPVVPVAPKFDAPPAVPAPLPVTVQIRPSVTGQSRGQKALDVLSGNAAGDERRSAAEALTALDMRANPALASKLAAAALQPGSVEERQAYIRALARGRAANPEVITALRSLAHDANADIRAEAAIALANLHLSASAEK